ncbi:MAG: hypothetical protein CVT94_04575 [Bacteroidetes bacterium HGW-Bacteroidetes-11]|jgi:hypothetical protein|nr:MAG: hypothetical protein CVT94_04575 [Bacteroidetes bacterium HGW-Bacteroidetes-11]
MKKIWQLILAGVFIILASTPFTSCVDGDFEQPPIIVPKADFEANRTILQLKNYYLDTLNRALTLIDKDIVISGIVVANDQSGNLYKRMVIQDASGAIELSLDKNSLYNEYKVGQRLFIKTKGMYIGDYNNLIQLGYIFGGKIGRLPESFIPAHLFRDSFPGVPPAPSVLNLATLPTVSTDIIKEPRMSTLVKLENVRFVEVGEMFAPQNVDNTERTLIDQSGKSIKVRTSKYCNFASDTLPGGYGTVEGILSAFNSNWQFTLRSKDDVKEFGGVAPPPPGNGTGTFEDPYDITRAISTASFNPAWVEGYIVGTIDVGDQNVPNFAGPFVTNTNLLIAASADETNISNCMPVQLPSGVIRDALNLVTKPGNKGKQVKVLGTIETYFLQPGVKNLTGYWLDGSGVVPATGFFTEEFNQTLGTFTEFSVLGDQKWFGDTYDGGCVTMTGYVAPNYFANEDWLISPVISLAGKTGVELMFREAVNFVNNMDDVKVFVSTNYNGTDNPNDATWTQLTGFTRSTGSAWAFVNTSQISLAAFEGSDIRIAFKYISTTSKAGTWEISRVVVSASN